jgi:hypothetical protein
MGLLEYCFCFRYTYDLVLRVYHCASAGAGSATTERTIDARIRVAFISIELVMTVVQMIESCESTRRKVVYNILAFQSGPFHFMRYRIAAYFTSLIDLICTSKRRTL